MRTFIISSGILMVTLWGTVNIALAQNNVQKQTFGRERSTITIPVNMELFEDTGVEKDEVVFTRGRSTVEIKPKYRLKEKYQKQVKAGMKSVSFTRKREQIRINIAK